jgi:hypothetical protein
VNAVTATRIPARQRGLLASAVIGAVDAVDVVVAGDACSLLPRRTMGECWANSLLSSTARTVKDLGPLSRPGLSCTTRGIDARRDALGEPAPGSGGPGRR